MNKWILGCCLFAASPGFAVNLTEYPYANDPKPVRYEALSQDEIARAKPIPTDYVEFLFESPCDAEGKGADRCLWALVNTLFEARVAVQGGGTNFTLHYVRYPQDPKYDETKTRQFVSIAKLPADGVVVNGKDLRVTQWVKVEGIGPAVPMLWLPVTGENQKRIDNQYYQGLRTGPREIRLLHNDLQGRNAAPGEAFFVVMGFRAADAKRESRYFVARRHATEPNTFTGVLTRARYGEGEPALFNWMGYTFKTSSDQPVSYESLLLQDSKSEKGEVLKN